MLHHGPVPQTAGLTPAAAATCPTDAGLGLSRAGAASGTAAVTGGAAPGAEAWLGSQTSWRWWHLCDGLMSVCDRRAEGIPCCRSDGHSDLVGAVFGGSED